MNVYKKTNVDREEKKNTSEDDGQDLILKTRPQLEKIIIERAKADKMLLESKQFLEDLQKKFYATDQDIADLVRELNDHYNPKL